MKKMKKMFVLMIFVLGGVSIFPKASLNVSAAEAVKVKAKHKYTNGKEYLILTGYSKKNKKVWTHKSDKHPATQVTQVTYKKRKNRVYLFDGNKLKIYRLSSGKKLKQVKIKIRGGHSFDFDSKDNLYLTGYFYNTIYKLDKNGRVKWHRNIKRLGLSNAYGTTYKKGMLTVYYEISPLSASFNTTKDFYVKLNAKNGKLISYRR